MFKKRLLLSLIGNVSNVYNTPVFFTKGVGGFLEEVLCTREGVSFG